jgi:hypothetical protein
MPRYLLAALALVAVVSIVYEFFVWVPCRFPGG